MSNQTSYDAFRRTLRDLTDAAHRINSVTAELAARSASASAARGEDQIAVNNESAESLGLVSLTPAQRLVCERIVNVFETGSIRGNYAAISIFEDGPNDIRQITYGRSQTTEYGNLRELVQMYVDTGGRFSEELREFVPRIGRVALVDDSRFKNLLRRAGAEDPVMRQTQDVFFDRRYFQPALRWADRNGFTRALSTLVIYDSFIHSGGILDFLRARFPEMPPARGGDEQVWIRQYVDVRHGWLRTHHRPAVRASIYRTRDLAREIARANWDLAVLPILANGVPVDDRADDMRAIAGPSFADDHVPYFGPAGTHAGSEDQPGEIWCEGGSPSAHPELAMSSVAAATDDPAVLATRILNHAGIQLATAHVAGVDDQATARQNIADTAAGGLARRSSYGNAPGGTIALDRRLLRGLLALSEEYTFAVSELVGGSHSRNSRHYVGVTADFNIVNARPIRASHPDLAAFKQLCRDLGATEVLGPGAPGHDTHVHAAWPRPA